MANIVNEKDKLVYRYDSETLTVEPWGKNSLRVRSGKRRAVTGEDWALLQPEESCPEIHITEDGASITNGKIKAVLSRRGKLTFYNEKGSILLEEFVREKTDLTDENCSSMGIAAREYRGILGGDYEIFVRFESNEDEMIFGMGQYQQTCLDLKGCDLELAQRNSQVSIPFYISSLGYGFLWNNPALGDVMFGKNKTTWHLRSAKSIDYWITAGDTPSELEESYAKATGTAPMIPEFATGFWQCKLRYQTQEELLEVAREYKKRGLPISVIVADYFHWPKQGEWKFDPTYWPDPDAMIAELKEMGLELMVSVWPTVD